MSKMAQYQTRDSIERFLNHYMAFHDAEVLSVELSSDESTLTIVLDSLCIIDPKTDWWRTTDTRATLTFDHLSNISIGGEVVEYGVLSFEIEDSGAFNLGCGYGSVQGNCETFRISAISKSEAAI